MGLVVTAAMPTESAGDRSGRPDTSGVDPEKAQDYARRMFDAVVFVRFSECQALHRELNLDWPMYTLALDLFREQCRLRGISSGRWREYTT